MAFCVFFMCACAQKSFQPQTPEEKAMVQVGLDYFQTLNEHNMDASLSFIGDEKVKKGTRDFLEKKFAKWERYNVRMVKVKADEFKRTGENKARITYDHFWRWDNGSEWSDTKLLIEKVDGRYMITDFPQD